MGSLLEAFRPWVVGRQERARTVVNAELNAPGLDLLRRFDVLDQLARIECPTLVCVGELDPIAPVDAAREIADALPGRVAQLAVVEGAGHFTWKDAPDRYWPLVTDFVTTTAGTTMTAARGSTRVAACRRRCALPGSSTRR